MRNSMLIKGMSSLLVLFSVQAAALPFNSIDPRSLGMGGTGVASGTAANAGLMNPALLAAAKEGEDFAVELPIVAARIYDPDKVLDEIDNYQNGNYETNLNAAVAAFTASPTNPNATAVATATDALLKQLLKLSNKSLQGEVMAGFVVGIPSRRIGASLTADAWAVGGGLLDVTAADQTALQTMINASGDAVALTGNTITSSQLTSNLQARGAVISEVGLSLAREVNLFGTPVAVGVTPKYIKVTTFDYKVGVNSANFDASKGKKEYSGANLDVGLAKDYKNGWKTGVVAKNLISKDYETQPYASPGLTAPTPSKIKIEPQLRAGVSHNNDWSTVALDVDLKENKPVGFDSKTQYIGLGAELDVFDLMQVRIGYRHNMKNSKNSIPTIGLGFSPFGAHLDFSAGANGDETALSMQLGFRF
ncbi:MAG: conjugal transfer protein TraF [Gammaproteobacteria bacterium]|nr:conjugal transfer protein TraF [Gammaproteobacteria bacterium]